MRTLFTIFLLSAWAPTYAQADSIYRILRTNDSLLFNIGYNTCDIAQFENLLSEDFEFYHDEAGIMESKEVFITSVRDGLCKLPYKANRVLKEGSLRVHVLKNKGKVYGALQMGEHSFYAIEKGKAEYLTSTAQFTSLWLLQNNKWKLSRVMSYDHVQPKK